MSDERAISLAFGGVGGITGIGPGGARKDAAALMSAGSSADIKQIVENTQAQVDLLRELIEKGERKARREGAGPP